MIGLLGDVRIRLLAWRRHSLPGRVSRKPPKCEADVPRLTREKPFFVTPSDRFYARKTAGDADVRHGRLRNRFKLWQIDHIWAH